MILNNRSSGLLLHITSLPSPFGIGDLGPEAYRFAEQLAAAGQRFWQILPLNPTETGYGNSPYSSHSAFAGNPLLISPELLAEEGLLGKEDLQPDTAFPDDKVDFEKVTSFKRALLEKAWQQHTSAPPAVLKKAFARFEEDEQHWLEPFARFAAFKQHFGHKSWVEWPEEIRHQHKKEVEALAGELTNEINFVKFQQFLFYRQWFKLKAFCEDKAIAFFGDMPFYVSHDSADVWMHPTYFKLDKEGQPTHVSGVPPDYFSETGQLWGTPVFNWQVLARHEFDWWIHRIEHNLKLFGLLRLDHFRAFSAYWEICAGEKTAVNGKWAKSPGEAILRLVQQQHQEHPLPIIAEDLGEIDEPVRELMREFDLPGMLVLLFAFGEDLPRNPYAPHNHSKNSIVYTGTHDNSTVRCWFEKDMSSEDKHRLSEYTDKHITKENVHEVLLHLAFGSVAQLAVVPVQDVLGLGAEATMNKPSVGKGNWEWRLKAGQFGKEQVAYLQELTALYGRA
ncbi:4-alpha-glucanotransferase [Pontibacter liquoris]|uniref:4-alpha-glucanotransferase n=1 Tax=Pontibacter liquoris TaxID=2905677 RepID=UPI001FA7D43E|nr:4-alpha-glucanotransferase [Pontibacter liquoris]